MNCNKYIDERILFAYGESDDTAFAQHLHSCATCQAEVALYKTASAGTRSLSEAPQPSLSNDRLRQAILSAELKPRVAPWILRLGTAGASAAAVVAVWLAVGRGLENTSVTDTVVSPKPPIAIAPTDKQPIENVPAPYVANNSVEKGTTPVRRHRVSRRTSAPKVNMPDLVAVASSGVTQAMDVFAEMPPPAPAGLAGAKKDAGVIVIQPDGSGANERSSSDVSIGG